MNDEVLFTGIQNIKHIKGYYYRDRIELSCLKNEFPPLKHQDEGIRWLLGHLQHAVDQGRDSFEGALLADDMGLGKTYVVLSALALWQHMPHKKQIKPSLVVAPVGLLDNWKEEIDKFFSECPFSGIVTLHAGGNLKSFRNSTVNDGMGRFALKLGPNYGKDRLDMPGRLVLTSYDGLRLFPFSMGAVDWGMVVFDEAQTIKNPNALCSRAAKGLKADFRLAVTGTPVENSLIDFWNIFDTVYPGFLDTCQKFRGEYIKPILDCKGSKKIRIEQGKRLRKKVSHFMLRRTKEDQLPGLPNKTLYVGVDVDGVSLSPIMDGRQLMEYDAVLSRVALAKQKGADIRKVILSALQELKNISLHPDLVQGGNIPLPSNAREARKTLEESAKIKSMLAILERIHTRQEKVIIFVINKKLQFFLAIALRLVYQLKNIHIVNGDIKTVSNNASGETRKSLINDFQSENGFGIIIMSPLAAGVGLTITGANNVIHLERHWNPAKEAQASDRVYRIGQTKDVNIYIPILEHPKATSFDRTLDNLLAQKLDLKEAVVTPGEVSPEDFVTVFEK